MYRLFASDIDDTLTDHEGTLSRESHDAMVRLHAAEIEVVLSSGRSTVSMKKVSLALFGTSAPRFLISFNGAHLVDTVEDRLLFAEGLPPDVVSELAEYGRSNGLYFHVFDEKRFIVEAETAWSLKYGTDTSMACLIVPDVSAACPDGSPKFLFMDTHEALLPHLEALTRRADGRWRVTFSKPHLLEVLPTNVSKGHALTHLANKLGIAISDVVAVGDGPNDIEMIETAGVGIAVANAHPDLKRVADHVTTQSAEQGAVAEIIDQFFFDGTGGGANEQNQR